MFVWLLEAQATDPGEVGRQLGRWTSEFGETPGYLGATGGVTDDGRFLLLVRWESEDAGNELLMRPEQQAWYVEFQKASTVTSISPRRVMSVRIWLVGRMPPGSYRR